ncbi:MAG: patatin-like phospholipase family protein [Opitutales bacterium]|jgi:NTE family protein
MIRISKTAKRNRKGLVFSTRGKDTPFEGGRDGSGNNPFGKINYFDEEVPPSVSDRNKKRKTRPRVGLALSAGGARGLAHVGVIQVLEENGITVDCVAGSSMGAYVGACWCGGHGGKKLEEIALSHRGNFGPWKLLDLAWFFRRGLIHGNKLETSLRERIGDMSFRQMNRPFAISATRFDTLEPIVMKTGDVASAARASCSMPGICVPSERKGIELFDGGMTDPLAISALASLGVDRIIACCALRDPRHKRLHLRRKRLTSPRFRSFLRLLNVRLNPFAKGNVYDIVMRAVEAAQHRVLERDIIVPDVVIRPATTRLRWYAFHKPELYLEAGRRAAESQLDSIRALIETPMKKRSPS